MIFGTLRARHFQPESVGNLSVSCSTAALARRAFPPFLVLELTALVWVGYLQEWEYHLI